MNYEYFTHIFKLAVAPYTLRELEELTGISAATLSRLGRGTKPDLDTFFAFCVWAGISPAVFLQTSQEDTQCSSCILLRGELAQIKAIAERALSL